MADPLSIGASIAGLITISQAALAGVHLLITAIKEYDQKLVQLVQELAGIQQLLQLLRSALPDYSDRVLPGNPAFEPLRLLQTTLQDIENLKPRDSKREKASWIAFRKEKQLALLLQQLERHKSTISSLLSVHQVDLLRDALSGQGTIAKQVQTLHEDWHASMTRHEKKILQEYYHSDHPYRLFRSAQKLHQEHTGGWFVNGDTFTSWIKTAHSKLWVYGIPGAGKTVLSSLAIESAKQHFQSRISAAVIYFFCDNSIPESQDPRRVIGSLIYQLANSKPEALSKLDALHSERSNSPLSLAGDQLEDLHMIFQEVATYFKDISIIIDGVDECEEFKEVSEQLVLLSGDETLPIRLLFFSRDEVEIRYTLSSFKEESIAANNDDLKLYIASQIAFRTQEPKGDLPVSTQEVKDRIRERLAAGAQGSFRWVECQLDALCQCANESECKEILDNLPHGLIESYDRILDRINQFPAKSQDYVRKALQWICKSRTPLTLKALCEVVALKDGGECIKRPPPIHQRKLLQWCSSFLRHSTTDGLIEIAHYSVREYLKEPKYPTFRVTDECIPHLGKACLEYLLLKDYHINNQTSTDDYWQMVEKRPFRKYAVKYWTYHCIDDKGTFHCHDLFELAKILFRSPHDGRYCAFSVEKHLYSRYYVGDPAPPPQPQPQPPPVRPNSLPPLPPHPPSGSTSFDPRPLAPPIKPPRRVDSAQKAVYSIFLDALVNVAKIPPIHWASTLCLWQLTEWLINEDGRAVDSITDFGTPLVCTIDRSVSSLGGSRDIPPREHVGATLRVLISSGANVNRSFLRDGDNLITDSLLRLHISSAKILLNAGLLCDRKTLQLLFESSDDVFEEITINNVFETDQTYWQTLKASATLWHSSSDSSISEKDESEDSSTNSESSRFSERVGEKKSAGKETLDIDNTDLIQSTKAGNLSLVTKLVDAGADCDMRDKRGKSAQHWAAALGHLDIYQYLSERDSPGLLLVDNIGRTPLHLAASKGNVEILRSVHSRDPTSTQLDYLDHEGYSPLLTSAESNNLNCLQFLLECDPRVVNAFRTTSGGKSALHISCDANCASSTAVSMLLSRGLDPNARSNDSSTCLHLSSSIYLGDIRDDIIMMLLEADADPSLQRADGNLPVHIILSSPYRGSQHLFSNPREKRYATRITAIAQLSMGLENVRDHFGNTALHLLCKYTLTCCEEPSPFIESFLDQGYDPAVENDDGQSSLEILMVGYDYRGIVPPPTRAVYYIASALRAILPRVPNNIFENDPRVQRIALAALSRAINNSEWNLSLLLLDKVKDTSEINHVSMMSPLLYACQRPCSSKVFDMVVSKALDLSLPDQEGFTALHLSVRQNQLKCVRGLISHGADVNQRRRGETLETPLMMVNTQSDIGQQIVQELISAGADVTLRDSGNASPIQRLCFGGGLKVLALLSHDDILAAGSTNFTDGKHRWLGMGCFHLAALRGHSHVISFLLDKGLADVDESTDIECMTALHIAAFRGDILLAQNLLKAGANINSKNAEGETPLQIALRRQKADMMNFLLESNASLGKEGKSSVWMEVVGWNNTRIQHILRQAFKDVSRNHYLSLSEILGTYKNRVGNPKALKVLKTGLKYAIEGGMATLVEAITQRGLDLEAAVDDCGSCGPLIYALRLGQTTVAARLIDAGCKVDVVTCRAHDTFNFDAAHYAALLGDHSLLAQIVAQGYTCTSLVHPIHVAVIKGWKMCVELLLEYSSIKAQKETNDASSILSGHKTAPPTALLDQAEPQAISVSLDSSMKHPSNTLSVPTNLESHSLSYPIKADISAWPWKSLNYNLGVSPQVGWSALHLAVRQSQDAIVHLLLQYGAPINARDPLGRTPLHIATELGKWSLVNILLKKGADETIVTDLGETPLLRAIQCNNFYVAKRMIEPRTIGSPNNLGWTPLHYAVEMGTKGGLEVASDLLILGVNIESVTVRGGTALHVAAYEKGNLPTIQCLLEHGANVHVRDDLGETPLFAAVESGELETCNKLAEYGAKLDVVEIRKNNLLHRAIDYGEFLIAEWLLKSQPNLALAENAFGCTPIHFAMRSTNDDVHKWALAQMQTFELNCNNKCTSMLHEALEHARVLVVQEIIQRLTSAEFCILCSKSTRVCPPALTVAILSGHLEIVTLLLNAGADGELAYPLWGTPPM